MDDLKGKPQDVRMFPSIQGRSPFAEVLMSLVVTIAEAGCALRLTVGRLMLEPSNPELRSLSPPASTERPSRINLKNVHAFARQVFTDMQILDTYATLAALRRLSQGEDLHRTEQRLQLPWPPVLQRPLSR